jgi:hypothetical protein
MITLQQTDKRTTGYRWATDIQDVPEPESELSPALKKAMKEAEKKWAYHHAHPEEIKGILKKLQRGQPLFGGIGADEFKRRCRDEWN